MENRKGLRSRRDRQQFCKGGATNYDEQQEKSLVGNNSKSTFNLTLPVRLEASRSSRVALTVFPCITNFSAQLQIAASTCQGMDVDRLYRANGILGVNGLIDTFWRLLLVQRRSDSWTAILCYVNCCEALCTRPTQ